MLKKFYQNILLTSKIAIYIINIKNKKLLITEIKKRQYNLVIEFLKYISNNDL